MTKKHTTTEDGKTTTIALDDGAQDLAAMRARRATMIDQQNEILALDTAIADEERRQRTAAAEAALIALDAMLEARRTHVFGLAVNVGSYRALTREDVTAILEGNGLAMELVGIADDCGALVRKVCPINMAQWRSLHIKLGRRSRDL